MSGVSLCFVIFLADFIIKLESFLGNFPTKEVIQSNSVLRLYCCPACILEEFICYYHTSISIHLVISIHRFIVSALSVFYDANLAHNCEIYLIPQ